jgi:hypothetical protein
MTSFGRSFTLLLLPGVLWGHAPCIGIIDFYGLRTIPEARVRQALQLKEGDKLPPSKRAVEARLETIPGVTGAHVEEVCCEGGKFILYVGIEQQGGPQMTFRPRPQGDVKLPDEIVETEQAFRRALMKAVQKGDAQDDISNGHSLMSNPDVRAQQERCLSYAEREIELLRNVLHNSADANQRAIAAWVIGYAPVKRLVVEDLQSAVNDADEGVRNNAMRALGAIADLAARKPELGIHISPGPFVDLLNSPFWTDRNKATFVLGELTEGGDPSTLAALRERALPALVEMARWKSPGHAYAPFILLGRAVGLSDREVEEAYQRGDRESVIARALRLTTGGRK